MANGLTKVNGLETFRNQFRKFTDCYVIIGGTACSEHYTQMGFEFRSTKDIDLVLCAENLNPEFGSAFRDFLQQGKYRAEITKDGQRRLFRFLNPENSDYPAKIELSSRKPDFISVESLQRVAPVTFNDSLSYFSAVIMDEDYYQYLQTHKEIVANLSIASVDCLMILKAKAWLVLNEWRQAQKNVDSHNINKHKNDFFKLYELLNLQNTVTIPKNIQNDIQLFLTQMTDDTVDLKSLKIRSTLSDICHKLTIYFGLNK